MKCRLYRSFRLTKVLVNLEVGRITEVEWNMHAFERLVLDKNTKELLDAVVTNHLAAEKANDLVTGKGCGLTILLHGGPGTGKTLTAECLAENAHMPLYRMTCGDLGTDPSQVEKYLESVFHISNTWNCILLLDEADVFLEERSLSDLQRNSLVSIFLRVLEYFSGILILTSDRVGVFDEALKSRIQLSVHYRSLGRPERRQIWWNFLDLLKSQNVVDFDEIEDHLDDLADNVMNGRQIRNTITTARQLASYRSMRLNFEILQSVIQVSSKFDQFLLQAREG